MFQLATVCVWHAVVSLFKTQEVAELAELVFLSCLATIYIGFNIGIAMHIYMYVSTYLTLVNIISRF